MLPNWDAFTEQLVAPSPAVSRPPLSHFSLRLGYLPLQVTLTHFALSSYERAFHFSTFFPASGLARLGVKPRLCRSSWKAFASTHLLMLSSTSPREAILALPHLLGTCLPSLWSPPFPLHAPALIFFFRQGAALVHLDFYPSRSGALDRRLCSFSFWQKRL